MGSSSSKPSGNAGGKAAGTIVNRVLRLPSSFRKALSRKKKPGDAVTTPDPKPDVPTPDAPKGWTHPKHPDVKLSPEDNAAVDRFLERSRLAESKITPEMDKIADKTGSDLIGRDHRLKTEDSLKEKIARIQRRNPDATADDAIADINDSVRYTMGHPEDKYTDGVKEAQKTLKEAGFEPDPKQYKYKWNQDGKYQGINTTWRDPETGTQFEVQHHTDRSFWAKDEGTHDLYDQMKVLDDGDPRKAALDAEQKKIFNEVPHPNNVQDLKTFDGSFGGGS
ncbi:hypothetical protein [Glycomyces sp. NPDC047010]|uniref:hypothetical protein n=1 Tax=Glycomyces sp. NPDC047010 TaxID=3155023 RepID=UPI0033E95D5B